MIDIREIMRREIDESTLEHPQCSDRDECSQSRDHDDSHSASHASRPENTSVQSLPRLDWVPPGYVIHQGSHADTTSANSQHNGQPDRNGATRPAWEIGRDDGHVLGWNKSPLKGERRQRVAGSHLTTTGITLEAVRHLKLRPSVYVMDNRTFYICRCGVCVTSLGVVRVMVESVH